MLRPNGEDARLLAELLERLQQAIGDTYRIERELGGGGMSRVFLAEEVRLGRRVVIKVLPPEMGAGVNVERFEREVQLAAQLQHPHIVPLLTAGAQDDLLYYVMPYIKGESLRAKLAREGELPIAEAVRILRDVADALASAHREGVIHRDIKPDNVLLSDNHALVTDFGVAKAVSDSTGGQSLTSLGVALGTPAYMSPEQAAANPNVDYRADIYAVGALAYEMLCGQPPFSGPNPQAVLTAHVTQAPEPCTARRASVPAALNDIVMRCLEKLPADRYQNADDLRAQFESMTTPSGGVTPTGTQPVATASAQTTLQRTHPLRVAGLFGLASVGALAIVYALVQLIGLPNWVLLGAIVLLAIGLPIMLATGHQERRRAIAQTTGIIATQPSGAISRWFTWRKAIVGGGFAFGGLAMVSGVYMAMRLLGIGPVGTLVAAGVLEEGERIILADFADRTGDSVLATTVTEAFRIDLAQSPTVKLVGPSEIEDVLVRMERESGSHLDLALAQEIAVREGIKAVVAGEINAAGGAFVLSAQILLPSTGETVVAFRETAADSTEIVPAIDRLSKRLREKTGESLRSIRGEPPLYRVTTSSLPALRKYTEAQRMIRDGDQLGAVDLLEEAVALDSGFAAAYVRMGFSLRNLGIRPSLRVKAFTKALEARQRLPERERYLVEAAYHVDVTNDYERSIDAFQSMLRLDSTDAQALNSIGVRYVGLGQFERAESFFKRAFAIDSTAPFHATNLIETQVILGKVEEAKATLEKYAAAAPDNPRVPRYRGLLARQAGDYDEFVAILNTILEEHREITNWRVWSDLNLGWYTAMRGKLTEAEHYFEDVATVATSEDLPPQYLQSISVIATFDLLARDDPETAIGRVEAALEQHPLESMDPLDPPYYTLGALYARAGRPQRARALLQAQEEALPDVMKTTPYFARHLVLGLVALAENRPEDAVSDLQEAARLSRSNPPYALPDLARAYDLAGDADSAIAIYQRYLTVPHLARGDDDAYFLPSVLKRLGELYEAREDREQAIEYYNRFVELWEEADPELQPQVSDVRNRIAGLAGER